MTTVDPLHEAASVEQIAVPESIPGDYCVRYRGPDMPAQAIKACDVLVLADRQGSNVGQLVVIKDDAGEAMTALYEPGMNVVGVITGVMRRVGDDES